jgi:hypothetical protein
VPGMAGPYRTGTCASIGAYTDTDTGADTGADAGGTIL